MPRPKNYFPVSHDLLNDPELHAIQRKLGREIGPKFLPFWLWFLSRLDKTENHIKFTEDALRSACNAAQIRRESGLKAVHLLLESGWLAANKRLESGLEAANKPLESGLEAAITSPNYWKYHRTPEHNTGDNGALLTKQPTNPEQEKRGKEKIKTPLPPTRTHAKHAGDLPMTIDTLTPEKLVASWNATGLKPCRTLDTELRKTLTARIAKHPEMVWWANFFTRIQTSRFLTGQTNDDDPFMASLDWCVGPKNMAKIERGNYDNGHDGTTGLVGRFKARHKDEPQEEADHDTRRIS